MRLQFSQKAFKYARLLMIKIINYKYSLTAKTKGVFLMMMQSKKLICMLISLSIILTSFIGVITVDADSNDRACRICKF